MNGGLFYQQVATFSVTALLICACGGTTSDKLDTVATWELGTVAFNSSAKNVSAVTRLDLGVKLLVRM
jgi:hypothetical protein